MMYELKVENENGEILTLSGREDYFQIVSIGGLNPPNGNIHRAEVSGMDGSKFMSSKLEERNIVITLKINGNVERNRQRLYEWFKSKRYVKIYYSNESRKVSIEGWMETVECDLFRLGETMQISVICPDPYFQSLNEIITDISKVQGQFVFPFAFGADGVLSPTITDDAIEFSDYVVDRIVDVYNEGEYDTGVIITIKATGEVVNPVIYNAVTHEEFRIKTSMVRNDILIINTNKGSKSVTLVHDSIVMNQINKITRGSSWFNLSKGDNMFTYEADTGAENMQITFSHRTRYQAV